MSVFASSLAPLLEYTKIKNAVEILVTEPGAIWVETPETGMKRYTDAALDIEYFERLGRVLANHANIVDYDQKPYLAVAIPGGHRMQLCVGQSIKLGVALSIRIWRPRRYTLENFGLSKEHVELFETAIQNKYNILISGGMFSGKTTFTNALLAKIPSSARVISVEDTPELDLTHIPNRSEFIINRLATREKIDYVEVVKAIMRLRPDRTILGELSPDNTFLLGRILNMGHGGTISTLHAENPEMAFEALTVNSELGGHPTQAANRVFRKNIHIIAQIGRDEKTYARTITDVWINDSIKAA